MNLSIVYALAAVALLAFGEPVTVAYWIAVGVWLHLTERHAHEHLHEATEHGFEWDPAVPHSHVHVHSVIRHSHAHFPAVQHRHGH